MHTTTPGALRIAGGNIDLFSYWARRIQLAHLTIQGVMIMEQWRNPAKWFSKCWTIFTYSLVEENLDTLPEHSRKFRVCAPRDLAKRQGVPQDEFPETAYVASELINLVNFTLMGSLQVADVHAFAQTSANCVFSNHLDLHVHTQLPSTSFTVSSTSRLHPSSTILLIKEE